MLTNTANKSGRRPGALVAVAAALCASLILGVAPASAETTKVNGSITTTDAVVEPYMGKSGLDSFSASCLELKNMIETAEGGGFWGAAIRVALMPEWLADQIREWRDAYYEAGCDDFFGDV